MSKRGNPYHDKKTGQFTFAPGPGKFIGGGMSDGRDRVSKRKTFEGPVKDGWSSGIDAVGQSYERWHPTAVELRHVEKEFRAIGRNDVADMAKKQRGVRRVK